jgi:ribonuclease E
MKKKIIIDGNFPTETRVVLLDKNNNIEDIEYQSTNKKQIKSNIYLAKVTRVEPSLQAAFVDYGDEKSGFLPFSEIHNDYYNIPEADKKATTPQFKEITPPEITSEDLIEEQGLKSFPQLIDSDQIDVDTIRKMIDNKVSSDFNIEVDELDIDNFSKTDNSSDNQKYKIQEVIKKGQILLVQVTKEERGNKGASLTTYISLAGKYCVLMPNKGAQNGISRKISNNEERRRLKDIINSLTGTKDKENSSVIARTAGTGHTKLDIKRDYDYLVRLWNKIREATLKAKAPCFIHQEDGVILKTIRDMFDRNVQEIFVQGSEAYATCVKFMKDILPSQISSVKEYKNKTPIFTKFAVEEQLTKLYQPNVYLPSGGYIVINPTEALTSIDVNSGKATSERNVEEMALNTNLEAAKEIARQVRLRDLSGLLVLDFIDMSEGKNRKIVERSLREFLGRDKARIQTASISVFGLLEMSRQRLRPSFLEINSNICSHCSGKGVVRADESNSMLILRTIENEIYNGKYDIVNIYGIASSIIYLLNNKRVEIFFIEKKYGIKLNFNIDRDATSDSFSIEKIKLSDKNKTDIKLPRPALQDTSEIYNEQPLEDSISKSAKRKITPIEKTDKIDKTDSNKSNESHNNQEAPSKVSLDEIETDDQPKDQQPPTAPISKRKRRPRRKITKHHLKKDNDKFFDKSDEKIQNTLSPQDNIDKEKSGKSLIKDFLEKIVS